MSLLGSWGPSWNIRTRSRALLPFEHSASFETFNLAAVNAFSGVHRPAPGGRLQGGRAGNTLEEAPRQREIASSQATWPPPSVLEALSEETPNGIASACNLTPVHASSFAIPRLDNPQPLPAASFKIHRLESLARETTRPTAILRIPASRSSSRARERRFRPLPPTA